MSFSIKLAAAVLLALSVFFYSFILPDGRPRVLVFSETKGFHHSCIPFGIAAIQQIGNQSGFDVDTTTDSKIFTDDQLKQYQAVVFNSTTGNVLNGEQQAAFERYIQAGGGYMGIHSAADTEYDWPWYGKLAGAYFESHPRNSNIRKASIDVTDKNHPASSMLPDRWERTDEWYNYKSIYPDLRILASLDENTYEGGTNGASHPIAWYHEFDGGRAFYTGCGHTDESYSDPLYISHLAGGLKYAMGDGKPLDYSKSYSKVTPEQNRFVKTVLVGNLDSPMELATSSDGRVFFTEMLGNFSVYNTRTKKHKLIYKMPITNAGGTGLIGLTLDPNFDKNHYLYMYYAPAGQTIEPIYFNLSRFTLKPNDILDLKSEKILLRVPVQKNSGAHHGGSLAWDKNGNLFLSTGDGSSPFPSNGFAPLDERPGAEHFSLDAQRGAGNTNDFKGKVLRIHPEPDGTYTIPEGNLFPKGTEKTKPEIYVMGCRNPYRIAVNPKTSVLYWGEIGPDAGKDSIQGPRGYDEFNQAKKAGNFGWPYMVGNNQAYAKWDFATNTAGPKFDPAAPVNNSPNNTGLNVLPPAMSAMIWYPYAASPEFPELGVGGRSAMAGSFYEFYEHGGSPYKFPDYYDRSLFVFDWMRNWVINLRFDKDENYLRNEPFMAANGDFRRPIDMTFGKDGIMYMLEYGSVYGKANEDARLVKIEYYTGNRKPIAKASIIDSAYMVELDRKSFITGENRRIPIIKEISGQAPLRVSFNSIGSRDLDDDDAITYQWLFDGKKIGANTNNASYTYTQPGAYKAILRVKDKAGLVSGDTIMVRVGNTRPEVKITTTGNLSFADSSKPFKYSVKVKDKEDGKIDPKRIKTFYVYNAEPSVLDKSTQGLTAMLTPGNSSAGRNIMLASDCRSCHMPDKVAVGPSFISIAKRYKSQEGSIEKLGTKIVNGGAGSWGTEHVMNAHPQLSAKEAQEIVKYIFSLTDKKKTLATIPPDGSLKLSFKETEPRGQYNIVSAYTDKGGKVIGPLTGTDVITVRNSSIKAAFADEHNGISRFRDNLSDGGHKTFILLKNIDLTNIKSFTYFYSSSVNGASVEVRIDSRAGPVIASTDYPAAGSSGKFDSVNAVINLPQIGRHDVYFFAIKRDKPNNAIIKWDRIRFNQ